MRRAELPTKFEMAINLKTARVTITPVDAFGPSSCSRRRATSSFARVMSTETWSWKTGICHASVRRRAIVLRMFVSSRRSTSPGAAAGAGAAAGVAPTSARSTSSATIRPSGPVPVSDESSIPALAGDPAGERRRLDPAAVLRRLLPHLGDLLCGAAAALALLFARGAGRAFFLRILVDLLRRARAVAARRRLGRLLALLADERDRLADRHLALGDRDPQQHARSLGLDLLRHLVGVELVERLALLDRVALGLEPLDDRAGLHALAEPGELDLASHARPSA